MNTLLVAVSSSLFSSAVLVAGINYVRDRKSIKAKGAVDEQTVELQVDAASLVNMDKRLGLVERAHDSERGALEATIGNLRQRLDEALKRLEGALNRIDVLEQRVEFEDHRYRAAIRYIRVLRGWIDRQVPGAQAPTVPAALETDFDS